MEQNKSEIILPVKKFVALASAALVLMGTQNALGAVTNVTSQERLQLAVADAKANLDQAISAAGHDKKAIQAARATYRTQVRAIKKALGVK